MCQKITPRNRMAFTIRPRADEDLPECIEVIKRVYGTDGYPVGVNGDYLPFLQSGQIEQSWVAEASGKVVGHVATGKPTGDDVAVALWREKHPHSENMAVMERLFVDPASRSAGIAAQLIAVAMDWSRQSSKRLLLFVLIKDKTATALYKRLGWTQFGTTSFRYGDGMQTEALCFVSPVQS